MKSISTIYKLQRNLIILSIILFNSCASKQDIVYFQDEPLTSELDFTNNYEIKFKPADIITIDISAQDPEAVAPFLLTPVAQNIGNNSLILNNNLRVQTYLIDKNGNIEFPILGTLKIQGLSRVETTLLLKTKLSAYLLHLY